MGTNCPSCTSCHAAISQQRPLLPRLLLLAAVLLLLSTSAAAQPAALIVKFTDQAYQQARAAAAAAGTATVASAAADVATAAASAAAARGEDLQGQQRVADMAAAAAESEPSIGLLSSQISDEAARLGVPVNRRVTISTVFQGTVLEIGFDSSSQAEMLKEQLETIPAVDKVWISQTVRIPTPVTKSTAAAAAATQPIQPTASTDNGKATGIDVLRSKYPNLTGSNTLICFIDTGINLNLPSFGSCAGVGKPARRCKVVTGYDLVGDKYNGKTGGPPPVEGPVPNDCYGHGTSTASTAATDNGIAPGALLGAYRVFGCSGSTTDAIMIPAIDRAVRDGCHIINLSLSAYSGYADKSPYADVMAAAWKKGVIAVKAAGNDGSDGWYAADVTIAAGSAVVGSVGALDTALDKNMAVSSFSSFGPEPSLRLGPHVCAPGARINVVDSDGFLVQADGTSFATPYTSGLLALWRQYKQAQADKANTTLDLTTISQDAMLKRLVWTARPVREGSNRLAEPVLRCGGGIIQADALLANQLTAQPSLITIPSGINQPYVSTLTVAWEGPAHSDRFVTYNITHVPAYSVPLDKGWYGNRYESRRVAFAAAVAVQPSQVVLDTTNTHPVKIKVTFTLPANLTATPLLYSGYLLLTPIQRLTNINDVNSPSIIQDLPAINLNCAKVPTNASISPIDTLATIPGENITNSSPNITCTAANPPPKSQPILPIPQISIPYQGFSKAYSALRVMSQPATDLADSSESGELKQYGNMLCYAPVSQPTFPGAKHDDSNIPYMCKQYPKPGLGTVTVSLASLRNATACSLRVTLAPEVPMKWLNITVLEGNTGNNVIGTMAPIYTGNGDSLAAVRDLSSWCLNFNGRITTTSGIKRTLDVGKTYRLRAFVEGPLAAADAAIGCKANRQRVNIKGVLKIVQ